MLPTITKARPVDYLAMGLTALTWASAFVAIKVVVPETGPLWLATWRVLIGFIVVTPYVLWRGLLFPRSARMWALVAIASVFNVVIPFFLISWAEKTIDAGVAALLMGTGPFLALLGSHLLTSDDRITRNKAIGVLMGFAGILCVVGVDSLRGLGGQTLLAQLAAIGGAMSYVVAGLMVRRIDFPPIRLGWLILGCGSIILLALSLMIDGKPELALSGTALVTLLYLGIVPTGLGQILRFLLIRKVGYALFSLSLNLIPVFGVLLGALFLGEVISLTTMLALALVIAGLLISQLGPPPK